MCFRQERGFTLIELLVAFTIMALLLGIAPMAFSKYQQAVEYRASLRNFVTLVNDARLRAQTSGRSVAVRIDLADHRYGMDANLNARWPNTYQLSATVAQQEVQAGQVASIRFYPDGSSTGGSLTVLRSNGSGVRFTIDWLTGRLTQVVVGARA